MSEAASAQAFELQARGVVFDLDGTLTDNMPLHMDAFDVFVRRHGLPPLTLATRARLDGQRNSEILPFLFGRALEADELHALADEKEALYRELSRGRLRPLAGLHELLAALVRRGVPAAVATSAPALNVPHTLGELGLLEHLPHVVRSEQVPRGKPHPDVFLAAAERIGVAPGACLAFEDAPIGLRAARAAGMACVAVTTSFSLADFEQHDAQPDLAVRDYDEFLRMAGAWLR